ncbi:DUF4912 domain-containing protein [Brevibacillus sp. SYSU BS000544]|uniref:DUF4912 domain-containing protein n=1 Tax=Brevibacillus sp. SYSU BS000544 TaxID=3416443 RepID=UPI003CE57704
MIERILELRAKAMSIAEIADQCGLTIGQVKYQLQKSKRQPHLISTEEVALPVEQGQLNRRNTTWKLPSFYGENVIKLMPQGPTVLLAYWEITWPRMRMVANYLQTDYRFIRRGIRLYDVTDRYFNGGNSNDYRDVIVNDEVSSWYIQHVKPGRTYMADFGLFHEDRFCPILRSEPIATPRNEMAPWGDPIVSPAADTSQSVWLENFSTYSVYSK